MPTSKQDQPRPQKTIHFRGPLSILNIRGPWFPSMKDGVFVVVWGRFNHCFAYLHDFDLSSRDALLDRCRNGVEFREYPHGAPYWVR